MQTYCIIKAPPCVRQPKYALSGLVGLEFDHDPERIHEIRNDHPYAPAPRGPSCLILVDIQSVLDGLRELRRFRALQHWTCFAVISPFLYLPTGCCKALHDERTLS